MNSVDILYELILKVSVSGIGHRTTVLKVPKRMSLEGTHRDDKHRPLYCHHKNRYFGWKYYTTITVLQK